MGVQTYVIDSQIPEPVLPQRSAFDPAVTVYNSSATDKVYINDSTAGNGFPLDPGATITWEKALYARVDAGKRVDLVVLDNGGTITTPKAIAAAIVQEGLAGDIASALVASSLSGDIGNDIAVTGAPPRNASVLLTNGNVAQPAGGGAFDSARVDTTIYQSVIIRVGANETTTGAPDLRNVSLSWQDAGGFEIYKENFSFLDSANNAFGDLFAYATYSTSVKGPRLVVNVTEASRAANVVYSVTGSFKNSDTPRYIHRSAYWGGTAGFSYYGLGLDGIQAIQWNDTGAPPTAEYPTSRNGMCSVFMYASTITTAGSISIRAADSGVAIYALNYFNVSSTPQQFQTNVILPAAPVSIGSDTNVAGTNIRVVLTYTL